jgi:peptide deformylase
VVDSAQIFENQDDDEKGRYPDEPGVKRVFINARIQELTGDTWAYNEGCLSIPKVREDVMRHQAVRITYLDETLQPRDETFHGITARVILHEYDHIDGRLFIDHISLLKRKLLRKKLDEITKGRVRTDYRMLYPKS